MVSEPPETGQEVSWNMAWNDDPEVRELGAYAVKYKLPMVALIGVTHDGKLKVTTYGKSAALCKHAQTLGDNIAAKIETGEIEP
jgi:hypothetical protein